MGDILVAQLVLGDAHELARRVGGREAGDCGEFGVVDLWCGVVRLFFLLDWIGSMSVIKMKIKRNCSLWARTRSIATVRELCQHDCG